MKVDKSRVFIADVHYINPEIDVVEFEWNGMHMDHREYKTTKQQSDVVLVAFNTKHNGVQYVPISNIKNMIGYLTVKLASKFDTSKDKRFISQEMYESGKNRLFLRDMQNLYDDNGFTSLKDIKDVQMRHDEAMIVK